MPESVEMTPVSGSASMPSDVLVEGAPRPRRILFLAACIWLMTLGMGLGILWVGFTTDFVAVASAMRGVRPTATQLLVLQAVLVLFVVLTVGYATVGALLAGRRGAGRIAALLLAGGSTFALVPFGYLVGGSLTLRDTGSTLFNAMFLLGPVAIGPGYASILPGLAVAFPDGRLPSSRWRRPVGIAIAVIAVGTILELVRPGLVQGTPGTHNPFGLDALPGSIGSLADPLVAVGILAITVIGTAAVVVRYRRGDSVERQQLRWFLAAVTLAALPLVLSVVPGIAGPETGLVAFAALLLVPIAVGIAVTRYRLYEIDHLISRTLVYVPLTALLAGLYAAVVTLLQRVFQTVTGDRSDAAIIISTLILASVFTPIRKWLEGIVERRYKPTASAEHADSALGSDAGGPEWEARMAAIATRVVRTELQAYRLGMNAAGPAAPYRSRGVGRGADPVGAIDE